MQLLAVKVGSLNFFQFTMRALYTIYLLKVSSLKLGCIKQNKFHIQ